MASYLNKSYYCDLCKTGFDHTEEHNCISICKACQCMNCRQDFRIKCRNCDLFKNAESSAIIAAIHEALLAAKRSAKRKADEWGKLFLFIFFIKLN